MKGLVDSSITTFPCFFVHLLKTLFDLKPETRLGQHLDLDSKSFSLSTFMEWTQVINGHISSMRSYGHASLTLGFFLIVNNGVLLKVQDHERFPRATNRDKVASVSS